YPDNVISELCNFNNETGAVSPICKVEFYYGNVKYFFDYSIFSTNSRYLYVNSGQNDNFNLPRILLLQYDASKEDSALFAQSVIIIDSTNYILHPYGIPQLGNDGRIYFPMVSIDSLSAIYNPNQHGTACNFVRNDISLNGNHALYGLTQFIERYKAYIHHDGKCQFDTVSFSPDIWPPPDSVHWDFGDVPSGVLNTSNLVNPFHLYSATGAFTVKLYVRHWDNRVDSAQKVINIEPTPQVDLGGDLTVCPGPVILDAGYCSGCNYVWTNLSTNVVAGTNQTLTVTQTGNYKVNVSNAASCTGTDTLIVTISDTPQVTNDTLIKSICSGESTNISLISNISGTIFHWTTTLTSGNISGFSPDSGLVINQTLVNHLATSGIVTYHITPKVGSCNGSPVDFAVTINPGDSAKVSITASANNICAGTSVTFTATPTNPGTTPVYQWKVNGVVAGTNSPTFIYAPLNGDQVTCVLTTSITVCISNNPATSNTITMIVNPNLPVSVSVSPIANPVCAGTTGTFTAAPTHGGTTPAFQWKVNGVIVGTNSNTYSYIPLNNDAITCTLTSSETCTSGNPAISNQVTMAVNPNLPVSISISASSNPFCIGGSVTFTATPIHGGTTPSFQWKVNGLNAGTNSSTFSYNPISGDVVTCILASSDLCVTVNPATSNTITLIGNLGLPAGVTITASPNPFCPGTAVTFTATPYNGGSNPSYQWKVNGINAGPNAPIYTFNPANNDSVRCVMNSNLNCVSGNPATSNKIILSGTLAPIVSFTTCFDTITTVNAKPIKLKGGTPLNGAYTGPGVTANIFNPTAAGTGTKTITYTYTNVALCSASKTKTIIVQAMPSFICGNNLTDIRDGKSYPTVQIGSQCWFAANLNYGIMILSSSHQRDNCINEKYCYNDLTANCGLQTYYQWDEIMRYDDTPAQQGLCPPAWHVPTEAEWTTLFSFYINNGFAGSPLKYSGFSGFNALLSGVNHFNRQWDFNGFATFFWSSTPYGPYKAWAHGLNDYNPSVSFYPSNRGNGFSVRCLKDN
ncbi:MAG: FISUMP domain-containing protein, partial [Bacteroidota bacterium]